jgi:hypothetical protein
MELKKIAFFVEGYTEQEFLKKLLIEVFGSKKISVEINEIKGGSKVKISYTTIETPTISENTQYYILIYNCGGDSSIKSYILDRRISLKNSGYKKIIGLRDVYPDFKRNEIHKLLYGLNFRIPQNEIPIIFILSVMEIESWFIAEDKHFPIIDSNLSNSSINSVFGFNPSNHNTELIDEPSVTLKAIYKSVGKTYKKEKEYIDRTILALDYSNLYFNVNTRISSFKQLTDEINLLFEN